MTTAQIQTLIEQNTRGMAELRESQKETDRVLRQQLTETERVLKERQAETDRALKATEKQMKQTFARLESLFTGQWGKLIESLVEGKLVKLLRERGIDVTTTYERVKKRHQGLDLEIDIIAGNGKELVAVEVKTTLDPEDVRRFIEKLKIFKSAFPEFHDRILFGAVAYLRVEAEADKFACRQGLFVIRATGDSAVIVNAPDFTPTAW